MKHQDFMSYLVSWIEDNLGEDLSLESISDQSGHSKSNLQKIFNYYTIYKLGEYIRYRRLSQAAVDLKLTNLNIGVIAKKYNFTSQENFSRAFKMKFRLSPRDYRKRKHWNPKGMVPPLNVDNEKLPQAEFISFSQLKIHGEKNIKFINDFNYGEGIRKAREEIMITEKRSILYPKEYYGFHRYTQRHDKNSEKGMLYTIVAQQTQSSSLSGENAHVIHGHYLRFTYKGQLNNFQNFISKLFSWYLPMYNVTLSDKVSFEKVFVSAFVDADTGQRNATCYFYLPLAVD